MVRELTGIGARIRAGAFVLSPTMSLVRSPALQGGKTDQIAILIPEGFPLKFRPDTSTRHGRGWGPPPRGGGRSSWSTKYDSLGTRPAGANAAEVYLFPDTYLVGPNAGVGGLIAQQLDQFGRVITSDIRAQTGSGHGVAR